MNKMPVDLNRRHVVITGASRGIGAALAREAVSRGARVTLVARKLESLQDIAKQLGGQAFALDLAVPDAIDGAIDRIEAAAGPIDVFINNAAFDQTGPFIEKSKFTLRQNIETNIYAPIELCRQIIPRMIERQQGFIVMVSSIGGEIALANNLIYNSTKACINLFAATLQRELRKDPVDILLVMLGAVDTDMLTAGRKDPLIAAFLEKGKVKPLDPRDVAREIISALTKGKKTLVMPSQFAFFYSLRQIPTWLNDMAMRGVM